MYLSPKRERGVIDRSLALAALMTQPPARHTITTGNSMLVPTPR